MNKKLIWLASIALALFIGQPSFADCDKNQNDCNMPQKIDKIASDLDLTTDQKAKIKELRAQARESMKANYAQLKALRSQISQLVQTDKIDEAKVDSLVVQVNKIRGEMLKNRIMMQHQMYSILNEKQRAKFQELKKKWESDHKM